MRGLLVVVQFAALVMVPFLANGGEIEDKLDRIERSLDDIEWRNYKQGRRHRRVTKRDCEAWVRTTVQFGIDCGSWLGMTTTACNQALNKCVSDYR